MAHKYSEEVAKILADAYEEKTVYNNCYHDENTKARLRKFLDLTADEIAIMEVEMTLDGERIRDWCDIWNRWLRNTRVESC